MLSRNITTSWPHSTIRFAFSSTRFAIFTWLSAGASNVDAITSAFTVLAMSVTSSGRSSMRSIMRYASGWFRAIELAMSFMRRVLPVFGCATMSARCPLPIGAKRSTIREESLSPFPEHNLSFFFLSHNRDCYSAALIVFVSMQIPGLIVEDMNMLFT